MRYPFRRTAMMSLIVALFASGCAFIDQTESCIKTRYGKVVKRDLEPGIEGTWGIYDVTCFTLTEKEVEPVTMSAASKDQLTVTADVSVIYAFDPATVYEVFLDKRSQKAAEDELMKAIRDGYMRAINQFTVEEIFSAGDLGRLSTAVREQIQDKIGGMVEIKRVYVTNLVVPQQIEQARIQKARRDLEYQEAQRQAQIDSVKAYGQYIAAELAAKAKEVTAEAYRRNPALLQLEIAQHLKELCQGVQTCVIGGSVADLLPFQPRR